MKSAILYSTLTPDHQKAHYIQVHGGENRIFVRTEIFDGDIDKALSRAKPKEGEIVLNTIPLGQPQTA